MTKLNILVLLFLVSSLSGCWVGNDFSTECVPASCAGTCQDNICVLPGQNPNNKQDTGMMGNNDMTVADKCETFTDCTEEFGSAAVCNADGSCSVPELTNEFCSSSLGDPAAPNTLTIGVILALSGGEEGFAGPLKKSIEVAFEELYNKTKIQGADLAVVFCDNKSTLDGSLASAEFLVETLRVPAFVGPEFSSHVGPLSSYVKTHQTVMISPSATASVISTFIDDDLVWRTAPSDTFQAEGIAKLALATRDYVVSTGKPVADANIWVLTQGNGIYTGGLRDGVNKTIPAADNVYYGGFDDDFGPWVDDVLKPQAISGGDPDIVVILGFGDSWKLANTIDDFSATDPIFIFGDGGKNLAQAQLFPNLSKRVMGTSPQSIGDPSYSPYALFRTRYTNSGGQNVDSLAFLPHAYDAFFVIALAAGANGLTGPDIASGLKRISKVGGEPIDPTLQGFGQAIQILTDNTTAEVDYSGASGRLDFDANGDPGRAPISLFCFDGTNLDDQDEPVLDEDNNFEFDAAEIFKADGTGCLAPLPSQ